MTNSGLSFLEVNFWREMVTAQKLAVLSQAKSSNRTVSLRKYPFRAVYVEMEPAGHFLLNLLVVLLCLCGYALGTSVYSIQKHVDNKYALTSCYFTKL